MLPFGKYIPGILKTYIVTMLQENNFLHIRRMYMIHKKLHRIACIFFLMSIAIFLSAYTATITDSQIPIQTETTTLSQKAIQAQTITQKPAESVSESSPEIAAQVPISSQKPATPVQAQTDVKNLWIKNNIFNCRLSNEYFFCISTDAAGNLWVWTMTDDGQMYLSVGKNLSALNKTVQKVWYNIDAGISKQPVTLTNFSAGGVKKWTIIHTAIWTTKSIGPRPQITIEGTLWGIFAPDPKNKRSLKLLYKSINGKDGIIWQQEETLTKLQKYPSVVSATSDGAVFVLCDDGVYKRYADGSWLPLVQEKAQPTTSKITTKDKATKTATTKTPKQPKLKYIAAVNKDLIYALSEKNQVLVWSGKTWTSLEKISPKSDIKQIAVSPNGLLYCAANDGKAYFFAEKEFAWRPLGSEFIWNVQQVAASNDKVFAWTAELYKQALMKNQVGLTASDQGVIGVTASLGLTAGLILSPVGLIGAGVISIAASILSRPSLHEIYEWMGELPTPPEPKDISNTEKTLTPPIDTKQPTPVTTVKPVAKTIPESPEKTTEDVTAKLLRELEAINKQSEVKVQPKAIVTQTPVTTPAIVKPTTTPVVTQPPAVDEALAMQTTETPTEQEPEAETTPTQTAQASNITTPEEAPEEDTVTEDATPEETASDEEEAEETNQEFDPLTALDAQQ